MDVSSWLLAADRLSVEQWRAAIRAATPADFWRSVRDRVAECIEESSGGNGLDYMCAVPPVNLTSRTNSRVFVPLLLDAAGLLSADAQRAWRAHPAASGEWGRWTEALRTAQPVSVTDLVTRLQAKLRQQDRHDRLDETVCLLWQCAWHLGGPGAEAALVPIVQASKSRRGYVPGLVQEVLLETFGGQHLSQAAALVANAIRQAGSGHGAHASASAPPRVVGGFVQAANLVTGHGWDRATAAASESCDLPSASGAAAPRGTTAGPMGSAVPGPVDAPAPALATAAG